MDYEVKRAKCEVKCNREISVVTPKQIELSRETIINMEELVRSKNDREAASSEGYMNYIPHVPKHIQNDPYTPKFVSIGPYFYNDPAHPALQDSNSLKKEYLANLFQRGRSKEKLQDVYNECLKSVREIEDTARVYYAHKIKLKSEEFVAMLVLDGSFILEHLINYNLGFKEKQLWSDQSAPTQLKMDLIMLENQVPFFILEELFKRVKEPEFSDYDDSAKTQLLKSMVLWYLAELYKDHSKMDKEEPVYHMLHLVHIYARPQPEKELNGWQRLYQKIRSIPVSAEIKESEEAYPVTCNSPTGFSSKKKKNYLRFLLGTVLCPLRLIFLLIFGALENLLFYVVLTPAAHIFWRGEWPSRVSIPSATELQKVMVKVKKQNSGVYEVRLHDKTLFMSEVSIDGYTGPFLKNLVALEEASDLLPRYFSHYADFIQRFIRTREDVVLLQAEGILESNLGSDDEVISFFNNLVKDHTLIRDENIQISTVAEQLTKRYENPANLWWGMVMTNYLSNPWTIVALLVAAVQFLQTMLGLRDAEKSKKQ